MPSARAQHEPRAELRPPATLHRARPPAATRRQGGARREARDPSAAPVPLPARGGGEAGRDPRAAASAGQGRPAGAGRRRAPPRALPRLPARRPGRRLLRRGRAGGAAPKFAERPAPRPCGCCGCCWARRVSAGAGRPGALPGGEGACSARRGRARGLASAPASRRRPVSRGPPASPPLLSPPLRFPTSGRAEAVGAARGGAARPSRPPLGAGSGWGRPAGGRGGAFLGAGRGAVRERPGPRRAAPPRLGCWVGCAANSSFGKLLHPRGQWLSKSASCRRAVRSCCGRDWCCCSVLADSCPEGG